MQPPPTKTCIIATLILAAAIVPAVLPGHVAQATEALLAAASFWLTVGLATAGSALSAFCICEPVCEPKRGPYRFVGQWFIWLATPLLWGTVAGSTAFGWLKPFDLLAVLATAGIGRECAHAVCRLQWRKRAWKTVPGLPYLSRSQQH